VSLLIFDNVGRQFASPRGGPPVVALEGVNLQIAPHEFVCLLGPSGCGKSTLLNMVAGFDRPTLGRVLLHGQPIAGPGPDRGMVFQSPTLFPWLPVWENITFRQKLLGIPAKRRREIAQHYIELVGLQGFADRYPSELSGGMQQRVGIARMLALESEVWLLDEPFAALDAQTRSLMGEELSALWRADRRTAIFVTHSVEEALLLGTRVVVLSARPGRVRAEFDLSHLPAERDITAASFNEVKREVLALIKEEVLGLRQVAATAGARA
jgi:NitT/TauT family transport system ATP-binding protein